ncbi:Holliday junction resolvase RuvX [Tessaracoccus defluvii]|uniref:Putative pre-16S rRNA nuclease n=1 Tax=Tessaracoccus defluvii TaxID=1285901 RepID=A0A7H0H874_9ACTN|nr:Holliday junction resolvase RuvX [Tessaracoccus defluvii]QNP56740.1 Holliday junction resolvase RuvX [Tessaracoccus defluvii]
MADGPRLGIDWGKARIGVAAANRGTSFAYPVETVPAGPTELDRLGALVAEYEPGVVYVGLPLTLAGGRALAAEFVAAKAAALATLIAPVPVRLVDERMSTVTASRSLGAAGRRAKQQRGIIDQAAAVEILQRALDAEERDGGPAGEPALKEDA